MFKRQLSIAISITLFVTVLITPVTTIGQSTDSSDTARIRSNIERLSTERGKKVDIRLRDNTRIKGYISAVDQDTFTVSEPKLGTAQNISYADVLEAKRSGSGSKKPWFIFAGVAAAVIVTWVIVKPAVCDGGAQSRGIC
jgi:hypothetical protein